MDEKMATLNANVTSELVSLCRQSGVSECTRLNTILMDQWVGRKHGWLPKVMSKPMA
jgi:hypothetical protein